MEADIVTSKERLNNRALKRTGTKEVLQMQAVGLRDGHHHQNQSAQFSWAQLGHKTIHLDWQSLDKTASKGRRVFPKGKSPKNVVTFPKKWERILEKKIRDLLQILKERQEDH